jgi:hypothetical protein
MQLHVSRAFPPPYTSSIPLLLLLLLQHLASSSSSSSSSSSASASSSALPPRLLALRSQFSIQPFGLSPEGLQSLTSRNTHQMSHPPPPPPVSFTLPPPSTCGLSITTRILLGRCAPPPRAFSTPPLSCFGLQFFYLCAFHLTTLPPAPRTIAGTSPALSHPPPCSPSPAALWRMTARFI